MKELDCLRDCNSACCRTLGFQVLTGHQFVNFRDHGVRFVPCEAGMGIVGPCPMLEGKCCTIYLDRKLRPDQCFDVVPGDATCLEFRKREGYHDE